MPRDNRRDDFGAYGGRQESQTSKMLAKCGGGWHCVATADEMYDYYKKPAQPKSTKQSASESYTKEQALDLLTKFYPHSPSRATLVRAERRKPGRIRDELTAMRIHYELAETPDYPGVYQVDDWTLFIQFGYGDPSTEDWLGD